MTKSKWRAVAHLGMDGGGWTESSLTEELSRSKTLHQPRPRRVPGPRAANDLRCDHLGCEGKAHSSSLVSSCLTLSIHLRPCEGRPPPSTLTLSSRPERSGGEGPAVCVDGETESEGDSPTTQSLCPRVKLQVPPLRYPGFPVEVGGVGELHA